MSVWFFPSRVCPFGVCLFGVSPFGVCPFVVGLFGACSFAVCRFGVCAFAACTPGVCGSQYAWHLSLLLSINKASRVQRRSIT